MRPLFIGGSDRNSPWAFYQVTEDSQSPAVSTESETLDEVIRRLLSTPTVPPPKAAPIPSHESCSFSACWGQYGHPGQ